MFAQSRDILWERLWEIPGAMVGKRKGRHKERALTALAVRSVKEPGRYPDGGGLYLLVQPAVGDQSVGAKSWILRITVQGRRRDMGLGGVADVSLAEARELAARYRKIARAGGDPFTERRKASAAVPTLADAARRLHAEHSAAWRNPKHRAQWLGSLERHVFPIIGKRRIDQADTTDLLRALQPIWLGRPETARRIRQRLRLVFDWARAAGLRDGENPVGPVLDRALPRHKAEPQHHKAMPYVQVPDFVQQLRDSVRGGELPRLALELLILTATRTGEVLGAQKAEFDLESAVWTVPAARMKAGRQFRIPLSQAAVDVVHRSFELSTSSDRLFESARAGRVLGSDALIQILRRMEVDATVHGFRSSFRDWAAETTGFSGEVVEMALAHTIKSAVERAYRRGDLFQRRRELMEAWASFISGGVGKVVPLQKAQ